MFIVHIPLERHKGLFQTDADWRLVSRFKLAPNECVTRDDLAEIAVSEGQWAAPGTR